MLSYLIIPDMSSVIHTGWNHLEWFAATASGMGYIDLYPGSLRPDFLRSLGLEREKRGSLKIWVLWKGGSRSYDIFQLSQLPSPGSPATMGVLTPLFRVWETYKCKFFSKPFSVLPGRKLWWMSCMYSTPATHFLPGSDAWVGQLHKFIL